jgi:hypothetical protein
MKNLSSGRNWTWTVVGGLLVFALTAAALVVMPAAPAYADDGTPPNPEAGRQSGARLERAFEREQAWLARQAENLDKADAAAAKLAGLIDKAKANGVDTADLEAALAAFEASLARAEVKHDEAAAIIDAHAGFSGAGKVTDPRQALETVKSAGAALSQAAGTLKDAGQALRDAVQAWRQNHPRPQPTAEARGT